MRDFLLGWSSAVAGAAVMLLIMSGDAKAADITPQQAADIYKVAYGQCPQIEGMKDGCPPEWLAEMPPVHVVPPAYMCGWMKMPPTCRIAGMYTEGKVYVSERLDFSLAFDASILLHEYIHHFQQLKFGVREVVTCDAWLRDEAEAYAIQMQVLMKMGDGAGAMTVRNGMRQLRC